MKTFLNNKLQGNYYNFHILSILYPIIFNYVGYAADSCNGSVM